eukprot:210250-Prorocentrum_minimum.AAC.1
MTRHILRDSEVISCAEILYLLMLEPCARREAETERRGAADGVRLSRCKTARCAIQTAGDFAEEEGFYGEGWTSGEALT